MIEINNTSALIVIDMQIGFSDHDHWGLSNNLKIEENISQCLSLFRERHLPVIHVQHLSTEQNSPLKPGQMGVDFLPSCAPMLGERIFQKSVNSAFIGTGLREHLMERNISTLILVGYTSDHCVSTTARMSANFGFNTIVIDDCTATFSRTYQNQTFPAQLVHDVSLASLNNEFATVVKTVSDLNYYQTPLSAF